MIDYLADTNLLIAIALATLAVPAAFLVLFAFAASRRSAGRPVGPLLTGVVTLAGGMGVGVLLLFGSDPIVAAPLVIAAAVILLRAWRSGRRLVAGWFSAGIGIPLALLWGFLLLVPAARIPGTDQLPVVAWAAVGIALAIGGALVVVRSNPESPPPDGAVSGATPGSRSFGVVAEAIRSTVRIGPFGLPEMALLVAVIVTALVAGLAIPADAPLLIRVVVEVIAVAVIGTEAYVRGWTGVGRRAFEAFSWLGAWELAQARQLTGRAVPATKSGARAWLARQPAQPEDTPIRIELLLYLERIEEARALLRELSVATPTEAFEAAALADLVDWHAGGDGNLPAMERAAALILPADGDDHLRAEVSIATAAVRRRVAAGGAAPVDVVQPLLDVRERLGHRADGQVGRALRMRILPMLLIVSALLILAGEFLGGGYGVLAVAP